MLCLIVSAELSSLLMLTRGMSIEAVAFLVSPSFVATGMSQICCNVALQLGDEAYAGW